MSSSPLRRILSWLARVGKDREILALLGILALGAYLRLWNICHLFNMVHDYDEGAWSLAARFISQGYIPYQDFILTHPPLYNLLLASVYKLFGYSFFYGRYLSAALSLVCIIAIYFVAKKMYHPRAGLAAAALFAVSPMMVYFGRRSVQETLGILLILVAIYFAMDFVKERKQTRLLWCGLPLGLAAATKYIFIPAVAGIIVAIILLAMGEGFWQAVKKLGRWELWVMYACFAAIFYAFLLLLRWVVWLNVAVPFLDPMYLSAENVMVAVLVFALPFFISVLLLEKNFPFKKWRLALWGLRHRQGLWMLIGGTVLGFICVTGFFWIKAPQEFFPQTVLGQTNRPLSEFPSLVALIRVTLLNPTFLRMACLPILFAIPLIPVLLNKRGFSTSDCFLAAGLIVALILSQGFYHLPRYYVSVFPFLFLGISWLVPPVNVKLLTAMLKAGPLVFLAILLFCLSLSVILLRNYTGYDVNWPVFASNEEQVYEETIGFLEGAEAEKIYATSPSFPAISTELKTTLAFDTFALLWLEKRPPQEIVTDLIDEGVDYVVLDAWTRYWGYPYKKAVTELAKEVRRNSRLVKVIEPDSACSAEIYLLGAEAEGIFNGEFEHWVADREIRFPLGWNPVLIEGDGDVADISQAYKSDRNCVQLMVYEDGEKKGELEATHAGIAQTMPFPEDKITVEVLAEVNTEALGRAAFGPSVNFLDEVGHSLAIGFSDEVNTETVFQSENGDWLLVVRPAELGQWSKHSIDLPAYWSQAGWPQSKEVRMLIVISAHYQNPGPYAFYVAKAGIEHVQAETAK